MSNAYRLQSNEERDNEWEPANGRTGAMLEMHKASGVVRSSRRNEKWQPTSIMDIWSWPEMQYVNAHRNTHTRSQINSSTHKHMHTHCILQHMLRKSWFNLDSISVHASFRNIWSTVLHTSAVFHLHLLKICQTNLTAALLWDAFSSILPPAE